jgi:hypothetical protein
VSKPPLARSAAGPGGSGTGDGAGSGSGQGGGPRFRWVWKIGPGRYRVQLGSLDWSDNSFEQDRVFILSGPNVDVCRYIVAGWVANVRFENSTDADCNEPMLGLRLVQHHSAAAR